MSNESMKAYLAAKYMSGPKADAILSRTTAPVKKKKRKQQEPVPGPSSSALIVDDDAGWGGARPHGQDDDEDLADAVVEKDRSFKKRKTDGRVKEEESGWTTVRAGLDTDQPPPQEEAEDERPQVVEETPFVGGLVTSSSQKISSSSSLNARAKPQTAEELEAERLAQETVYRDTSGRRIDTKAERAAAARAKREREEREAKKMEWGKGLIQREEEEKRKQQLERERNRDLAVYADDKELNEELKEKERWNDPAAAFLTVSDSP